MSRRDFIVVFAMMVAALLACRPPPVAPPEMRLKAASEDLYVVHAPPGAKRGSVFLVMASEGEVVRQVALVEGVDNLGDALKVHETCSVPPQDRGALLGDGLRVVPLAEDTRPRVGKCFATYRVSQDDWSRHTEWVDLALDLGYADGLKAGDRFEILGEPIADSVNRTVTGFKRLAECTVKPFPGAMQSRCRADKIEWPLLDMERAVSGGYALAKT